MFLLFFISKMIKRVINNLKINRKTSWFEEVRYHFQKNIDKNIKLQGKFKKGDYKTKTNVILYQPMEENGWFNLTL